MAVSRGRPHKFIVYQRGRGHEPVTVAGSIRSFVAVNAIVFAFLVWELLSAALGAPALTVAPGTDRLPHSYLQSSPADKLKGKNLKDSTVTVDRDIDPDRA